MITLLFGINDVIWQPFCFQNKYTITLRQALESIYILCKSDEASCNILSVAMATVAARYPPKPNQLEILLG